MQPTGSSLPPLPLPCPGCAAPSDLVHRQLTRVSTLQRLFRPSMTSGLRRHEEGASLELPARRSFKERVSTSGCPAWRMRLRRRVDCHLGRHPKCAIAWHGIIW